MRGATASKIAASRFMSNVASIGLGILSFSIILFAIFFVISELVGNDAEDKVPHPDYEKSIAETIEHNRDNIDNAVRLAAESQNIDIERACEHGKYALPQSAGASVIPNRTDTERLVQCGGSTFGALLYADTDGMDFQSISTSTDEDTFTVVVGTGDTARDKAVMYSSVRFPGVQTTMYGSSRENLPPVETIVLDND